MACFFIVVFLISLFGPSVLAVEPAEITLGGLFVSTNADGVMRGATGEGRTAMRVAIHVINNDPTILPNTKLSMVDYDTTSASEAILASVELSRPDENGFPRVPAIVGPAFSSHVSITGQVASAYRIPQVSPSSTSVALSDKRVYPFTFRAVAADDFHASVMADTLHQLGLSVVCTISTSDLFGIRGLATFQRAATKLGIVVRRSVYIADESLSDFDVTKDIEALKNDMCQIIVVYTIRATVEISRALEFHGLLKNNTVLVLSEALAQTFVSENDRESSVDLERLAGFIGFVPYTGPTNTPQYEQFTSSWRQLVKTDNTSVYNEWYDDGDLMPTTYGTFHAYDATWAIAHAIDDAIKAGDDPRLGEVLHKHLIKVSFVGVTGNVSFDINQDRASGSYRVVNGQIINGTRILADIGVASGEGSSSTILDRSNLVFRDGTSNVPDISGTLVCQDGYIYYDGSCFPCPPGKFADRVSSSCVACERNTYNSETASDSCTPCPDDSISSLGSSSLSDCLCTKDFYKVASNNTVTATSDFNTTDPSSFSCLPCPVGCACIGGEFTVTAPGFYDTDLTSEPGFCHDGTPPLPCLYASRCIGSSQCKHPFDGLLCLECVDGYTPLRGACVKCPGAPVAVVFGMGAAVSLFAVLFSMSTLKALWSPGGVLRALGSDPLALEKVLQPRFRTLHPIMGAMQTLAIAFRMFNLQWTPRLRNAMVFMDFINLSPDVGTAECASVPRIAIWALGFVVPLFLVAPVAIVALARRNTEVAGTGLGPALISSTLARGVVLTAVLLSDRLTRPFDCTKVAGGYIMDGDPNVQCWTGDGTWVAMFTVSIVFLIAACVLLWRVVASFRRIAADEQFMSSYPASNKRGGDGDHHDARSEDHHHSVGGGSAGPTVRADRAVFTSLCLRYRRDLWWWESVATSRRVALLAIGAFTTSSIRTQCSLATVVVAAYLFAHTHANAYRTRLENGLETLLSAVLLVILLSGSFLESSGGSGEERALEATVIGALAFMGVACAVCVAVEFRRSRREQPGSDGDDGGNKGDGSGISMMDVVSGDRSGDAQQGSVALDVGDAATHPVDLHADADARQVDIKVPEADATRPGGALPMPSLVPLDDLSDTTALEM